MNALAQLLGRARPAPKVAAGLIAFAIVQVLEHVGAGPSAIGLDRETATALIVLAAMWLRRDRREEPFEAPAGRERIGLQESRDAGMQEGNGGG